MSKSYVTLEQNVCMCCNKKFDTNNILLDNKLRDRFEMHTTTGISLCEDCKKPGFVLLIEIDLSKSQVSQNGKFRPEDVYKTGVTVYVKKDVAKQMLNIPNEHDVSYIDPDVTAMLKQKMEEVE